MIAIKSGVNCQLSLFPQLLTDKHVTRKANKRTNRRKTRAREPSLSFSMVSWMKSHKITASKTLSFLPSLLPLSFSFILDLLREREIESSFKNGNTNTNNDDFEFEVNDK